MINCLSYYFMEAMMDNENRKKKAKGFAQVSLFFLILSFLNVFAIWLLLFPHSGYYFEYKYLISEKAVSYVVAGLYIVSFIFMILAMAADKSHPLAIIMLIIHLILIAFISFILLSAFIEIVIIAGRSVKGCFKPLFDLRSCLTGWN